MNAPMRHTNKRAGRKRIIGRERYDNGKTKPDDGGPSPALVREIIYGALKMAVDPLLRTELGRMRLAGFLTDDECIAGVKLGAITANYDRVKGIPPRFVRSPDYMGGYGKSLREEPEPREIERVISRYDAALRSLGKTKDAVVDVVIYDLRPVGELDMRMVKEGLGLLCTHLGLTNASK